MKKQNGLLILNGKKMEKTRYKISRTGYLFFAYQSIHEDKCKDNALKTIVAVGKLVINLFVHKYSLKCKGRKGKDETAIGNTLVASKHWRSLIRQTCCSHGPLQKFGWWPCPAGRLCFTVPMVIGAARR